MSKLRNLYENIIHSPFIRALLLSLLISFVVFYGKDVDKKTVIEFTSKVNFLLIMGNISLIILTSSPKARFGQLTDFKTSIVIATLYLVYYFWDDLSSVLNAVNQ